MGDAKARTKIIDVAAEAGVHPSTVSRVLTGHAGSTIRPATRERVLAAADRLGYRPSALARSLRLQRTLTLGMLVPDITNPFFSSIIKGAEGAARQRGYNLILCNSEDDPQREATYLRVLRERQVDGLLIASSQMADDTIAELREEAFPFVLLNRATESAEDLAVVVDNHAAAVEVVAHLAALGHRRVGHIAGPQNTTTGVDRLEGYRAGVLAHGLADEPELVVEANAFSEEAGHRALGIMLAGPPGRRPCSPPTTSSPSACSSGFGRSAPASRTTSRSSASTTSRWPACSSLRSRPSGCPSWRWAWRARICSSTGSRVSRSSMSD